MKKYILFLMLLLVPSVNALSEIIFYDDFNDNSINLTKWFNSDGCEEAGGEFRCGFDLYPYANARSVDLTVFGFNASIPYNISFDARINTALAGRECLMLMDVEPVITEESGQTGSCRQSALTQHGLYWSTNILLVNHFPSFTSSQSTTATIHHYEYIFNGSEYFIKEDGIIMNQTSGVAQSNKYIAIGSTENDQAGGSIAIDNFIIAQGDILEPIIPLSEITGDIILIDADGGELFWIISLIFNRFTIAMVVIVFAFMFVFEASQNLRGGKKQ